jgi:hypothetical protein
MKTPIFEVLYRSLPEKLAELCKAKQNREVPPEVDVDERAAGNVSVRWRPALSKNFLHTTG